MPAAVVDPALNGGKLALTRKEFKILYNNILQNIQHRLDLRLPSTDSRVDPTSHSLESSLSTVFRDLVGAILIDGEDLSTTPLAQILKVDDADDNVEPYDHGMNQRLTQLNYRINELMLDVTKSRRDAPLQVEKMYEAFVRCVDDEVAEMVASIDREVDEQEQEESNGKGVGSAAGLADFDFESLNDTCEGYMQDMDALNRKLPQMQLVLERYQETVDFLEKTRGSTRR
ncbi:uncharacterized protein LODBEIA_P59400 [Lodderomyces beijingensis]|uniref:Uncharacterized protein n=1 Tax=Lodderomyces beijingensis TaxID=1775926 RepID=A0ABP0ZW69_9ASCO